MGNDTSKFDGEPTARALSEMDVEMKHKLGKGVNYNLKVVIKGDKRTGKSNLFKRLQRKGFNEEYETTEQIQTATVDWDYKVSNDIVKLEVWDIVDKAPKLKTGSLKVLNDSGEAAGATSDGEDLSTSLTKLPDFSSPRPKAGAHTVRLDASTIDVYKGTHAVIFMLDPRKKWSFEYVERELPKVPKHIPIIILVNFRDLPQTEREVSESEMRLYAEYAGENVRVVECSMKNCYGMKPVRCFFNVPFLALKRRMLEEEMKRVAEDEAMANTELELVTSEQNYIFYLKWVEENRKRKRKAELLPPGPDPRVKELLESQKSPKTPSASTKQGSKPSRHGTAASRSGGKAIAAAPSRSAATGTKLTPAKRGGLVLEHRSESPHKPAHRPSAPDRSTTPPVGNNTKPKTALSGPYGSSATPGPEKAGLLSRVFGWGKKKEEPRSNHSAAGGNWKGGHRPRKKAVDVEGELSKVLRGEGDAVAIDQFVPEAEDYEKAFWGSDSESDGDQFYPETSDTSEPDGLAAGEEPSPPDSSEEPADGRGRGSSGPRLIPLLSVSVRSDTSIAPVIMSPSSPNYVNPPPKSKVSTLDAFQSSVSMQTAAAPLPRDPSPLHSPAQDRVTEPNAQAPSTPTKTPSPPVDAPHPRSALSDLPTAEAFQVEEAALSDVLATSVSAVLADDGSGFEDFLAADSSDEEALSPAANEEESSDEGGGAFHFGGGEEPESTEDEDATAGALAMGARDESSDEEDLEALRLERERVAAERKRERLEQENKQKVIEEAKRARDQERKRMLLEAMQNATAMEAPSASSVPGLSCVDETEGDDAAPHGRGDEADHGEYGDIDDGQEGGEGDKRRKRHRHRSHRPSDRHRPSRSSKHRDDGERHEIGDDRERHRRRRHRSHRVIDESS